MTDLNVIKTKKIVLLFASIAFFFPITLISEKTFAIYTIALSLFGVVLYFKFKKNIFDKRINNIFNYIFIIVLLLLIGFLFENYKANNYSFIFEKMKPSESILRMTLLSPLFLVAAKTNISKKALSFGIIFALVLMSVFALYLQIKTNYARVFGKYGYENLYAYVQLILCMLLIIMHKEISKIYITIALLCGFYTVISTGTRGAWLGIPLLFLVIIYLSVRSFFDEDYSVKKSLIASLLGVFFCIFTYLLFEKQVVDRVNQTKNEISLIKQSQGLQTSIGTRLELWRIATDLAKENIIFGDGWGAYRDRKKQLIEQKKISPALGEHLDPHNIYLLVIAEHGIVFGIFFLGCIFFGPIIYLYAAKLKIFQNGSYPIILFLLMAGIFLLSESVLHRFNGMHWFASFWFLLFGWMVRHATVKK